MAPVQGYVQGIPWEMHLRAYNVYCKRYGPQPALIEGSCRGGFHVSELDDFIPGWRDELEELPRLRKELTSAHAELTKLRADNERLRGALSNIETWSSCAMTAPEAQAAISGFEQIFDEAKEALAATSSEPVVPWSVEALRSEIKKVVEAAEKNPQLSLGHFVEHCQPSLKRSIADAPQESMVPWSVVEKQVREMHKLTGIGIGDNLLRDQIIKALQSYAPKKGEGVNQEFNCPPLCGQCGKLHYTNQSCEVKSKNYPCVHGVTNFCRVCEERKGQAV